MEREQILSRDRAKRIFDKLQNRKNSGTLVNFEDVAPEPDWFGIMESDTPKSLEPIYQLNVLDLNRVSRVAKLEFIERKYYRTIDRYVTRNYVKYPVYSEWKMKEKSIKKTIKLTNQTLENLNLNDDELVAKFAEDIVIKLDMPELYPSWFIKKYLEIEFEDDIKRYCDECELKNETLTTLIHEKEQKKENLTLIINKKNGEKAKIGKKKEKLIKKIDKIDKSKPNFFYSLITLFIYNYMKSRARKAKLVSKSERLDEKIKSVDEALDGFQAGARICNELIESYYKKIAENGEERERLEERRRKKFCEALACVTPLLNNLVEEEGFIRLNELGGIENNGLHPIKGVYIIHNRENDKCYVGQSKDVMKRLRQHFKDTVPKNVIFAEDYFTSNYKNKDEIFEVKIIPCETKDELDDLEREMIFEYDAMKNGYNGTSGNI